MWILEKIGLDKRGQSVVKIALLMPMILGFMGLALDVGWVAYHKSKISNAADLAALAGAQLMPKHKEEAITATNEIFEKNYGRKPSSRPVINYVNSNQGINVKYNDYIRLLFLPIFGFNATDVTGKAEAVIQPLNRPKEMMPIAISNTVPVNYDASNKAPYTIGDLAKPKRGCFAVIAPMGGMSMTQNDIKNYIVNNYKGEKGMPCVGEKIYPQIGDFSSIVKEALEERLSSGKNTFICPIVVWKGVNGEDGTEVIGYAIFELEKVSYLTVNRVEIIGKFRETIVKDLETKMGIGYYGIKSIRFSK